MGAGKVRTDGERKRWRDGEMDCEFSDTVSDDIYPFPGMPYQYIYPKPSISISILVRSNTTTTYTTIPYDHTPIPRYAYRRRDIAEGCIIMLVDEMGCLVYRVFVTKRLMSFHSLQEVYKCTSKNPPTLLQHLPMIPMIKKNANRKTNPYIT
jgi:hypothetical protein